MEDIVAKEGRDLRFINLLCTFGLVKILLAVLERQSVNRKKDQTENIFERRHIVTNILLFPVLFFFYGLYYTDVISVLSVLTTYLFYLKNDSKGVLSSGLLSLWFRQTNIIWVALFNGGLELTRILPSRLELPATASLTNIIQRSGEGGAVYDPPIENACLEGMYMTMLGGSQRTSSASDNVLTLLNIL